MIKFEIREIKASEIYLLREFLYEAIFQKDQENPLPKDIVDKQN